MRVAADWAHSVLTHLYQMYAVAGTSPTEIHSLGRVVTQMKAPKDIPCVSAALDLFGWLRLGFGPPLWVESPEDFTPLRRPATEWRAPEPDTFIGGNEFPYRTNTSLGDATAPAGEGIGMGFAYAATKILDVLS